MGNEMQNMIDTILNGHVPTLSIVFMIVSMILSFAIPICGLIYLRKKFGCSVKAFFGGAVVWLLFASILESIIHSIVLSLPVGTSIRGNIWLYGTYGAFMAALFEECGRLLYFKKYGKKLFSNDRNALMYGLGHGGIEAIYILGVGMVNNIITSVMINTGAVSGAIESLEQAGPDVAMTSLTGLMQLVTMPSGMFIVGIVERILAMTGHIAMTIPVWYAVKNNKPVLFALSFAMHFVLDFVTAVSNNFLPSVVYVEVILLILVCAMVAISWNINKKEESKVSETDCQIVEKTAQSDVVS